MHSTRSETGRVFFVLAGPVTNHAPPTRTAVRDLETTVQAIPSVLVRMIKAGVTFDRAAFDGIAGRLRVQTESLSHRLELVGPKPTLFYNFWGARDRHQLSAASGLLGLPTRAAAAG